MVGSGNKETAETYTMVFYKFMTRLMRMDRVKMGKARQDRRQGEFLATLSSKAKELGTSKDVRARKD